MLAQTAPEPQTHYKHGQGYQHSFEDAEKWAKAFDDPARDAWQKPDEVLNALHLQRTDRVADLGAGTGYFSVRIARLVPEGKVFSVDIEPEMLRHLRERAHHHHIDNRIAYFSKLKASLRANGRLAIVDFKADSPEGPPPEHRIPPGKVTSELEAAGYSLVATHPFLPRQYFLVFQAKTS